jgi:hypothetical protein
VGATVQLLNRYERVLAKAITAADGRFVFASLPLDTYGVRVSQPSFLPAFRDRIIVKPGQDSLLQIHLATLFSNIQVSYRLPSGAMTNDWKWVLRTSPATRPVTRYLPVELKRPRHGAEPRPQIFSDTHGMVRLDGGDVSALNSGLANSDLGSVFALSTNLYGKNQLQIAGSFGQTADFTPSAFGLAAVYQREPQNAFVNAPEVTMTVSQFNRFGTQLGAAGQALGLRVMALNLYQVADPIDTLHLEYGTTGEAVDYVQHTARVSPFARATLALSPRTELIASYSDGGRPDALTAHSVYQGIDAVPQTNDLAAAVNALGRLPQISSRNGNLVLQRTQSYEFGYGHRAGTRTTYAFSGFYERVWNGQLNLSGNTSQLDSGNLLFDGMSKLATYNVGNYARSGYVGSVSQQLTDHLDFGLAFGRMGGFQTDGGHFLADEKSFGPMGLHDVAGANLRASIPLTGTRIHAGYGWVDSGSVVPMHVFTTQGNVVSPGLNFGFQQPIPTLFGLPGHLEITADLRNLLAQGYIPVAGGGASQLLVVQSPRAIRGGLNLTF